MNNYFTTTAEDLWRYPLGSQLYINKKHYMYVEKDEYDDKLLYDYETGLVISIEDIYEEGLVVIVGPLDLERLLTVATSRCLSLVQDGWTIGGAMDIQPYLDELRTIKEIHEIINDKR